MDPPQRRREKNQSGSSKTSPTQDLPRAGSTCSNPQFHDASKPQSFSRRKTFLLYIYSFCSQSFFLKHKLPSRATYHTRTCSVETKRSIKTATSMSTITATSMSTITSLGNNMAYLKHQGLLHFDQWQTKYLLFFRFNCTKLLGVK